jgi:hypothetical protein
MPVTKMVSSLATLSHMDFCFVSLILLLCLKQVPLVVILIVTLSSGDQSVCWTMEATGSPRVLQVAIPIFKNVAALDFVGPYEPLHVLPNVNVVFVSHSKGLYAADGGMLSIEATATFDEMPSPDIVVVPGGGTNALMADKPILDWIRKVPKISCHLQSNLIHSSRSLADL